MKTLYCVAVVSIDYICSSAFPSNFCNPDCYVYHISEHKIFRDKIEAQNIYPCS